MNQRHDLIPQLIGPVKGYMDHEHGVLTQVTEAKNKAMGASTISDIENKLASSRRYFNSATRELNTTIEKFPNNMVAGMFGF